MDWAGRLVGLLMVAGSVSALAGCGGSQTGQAEGPTASAASATVDEQAAESSMPPVGDSTAQAGSSGPTEPIYYAFAFDSDPGSPGCGPQARYVKIVGTQFYEVATYGCDASADRGTLEGDRVALAGRTYVCGSDPEEIEARPITMEITGGAADLRIPGETRVVGPTTDLGDLDAWWSEENERVPYPSDRDSAAVTKWMSRFAAGDWVGNGC